MAFPMLDTPRTEAGDQTRLSAPDYTTENSIPSPSKDGNSLLNQIRGLRQPNRQIHQTPRQRQPLLDRRHGNVPAKNEFTPLLKSATTNRQVQVFDKENSLIHTPAGLRASYHSGNRSSPALPFGSSVMLEEHTGSEFDPSREAPALPASSSSPMSTPMPREHNGVLETGNMATLREQEARLEQIDKENFSLKLKIHFLEEALRRNGKEFNENALKENTELKVDKVTLQRDLKNYRKQLAVAEKELEDYKRQLLEYAENVKRRHADENMLEEMERLRSAIAERDALVADLRRQLEEAADDNANEKALQEMDELKDTIADLEADLRDRDRRLDEREDEVERLKEQSIHDEEAEEEIRDLRRTVTDLEQGMREKDLQLRRKEDEIETLKQSSADKHQLAQVQAQLEDLKAALGDAEKSLRAKSGEVDGANQEIDSLREKLDKQSHAQQDVDDLRDTISDLEADVRDRERQLDEREDEMERLKDSIEDLEASIRDKERALRERDEDLDRLQKQANHDDGAQQEIDHLQQRLKAKDQELEGLEQARRELESLRRKLNERDEEIRRLQNLQRQLEQLRRQLDEKSEDLEGLRDALSRSDAETAAKLREKDRLLEDKDDELHELEEQLQALGNDQSSAKDASVLERDSRIKRLQNEIADLQGKLDDAEAELRAAQRAVDEKDDQLDSLKAKLQQLENETDDELMAAQDRIQELEVKMEQTSSTSKASSAQVQSDLQAARGQVQELRLSIERHVTEIQRLQTERQTSATSSQQTLRQKDTKIQELEDDIEYGREHEANLQAEASRLRERVQQLETKIHDHDGRKSDADNLRLNVQELEREISSKNTALAEARRELSQATRNLSAGSDKEAQLQRQVQDLEDELEMMQVQADDDLEKSNKEKAALQQDMDTLRRQIREGRTHSPRPDLQPQMAALKREKDQLQSSLASTSADCQRAKATASDLESSNAKLERQIRDLRAQVQTAEREFDRKLESQVAAYELDVRNLEQDLADSESKAQVLTRKNDHAEATVLRLRSKISSLESDLDAAVKAHAAAAASPSPSPSAKERGDLHQMLKKAKLEAEDLAIQVQTREDQITQASETEAELRKQLRRLREERNRLAAEADQAAAAAAAAALRQDQLAQPKPSSPDPSLKETQRRHARELAGLAKQIEYLAARVRREERFRADLQHTKHFFQKSLEMHAKCNNLDLKLVRDMGIPVQAVYRNEREREKLECPGRVQLKSKRVGDGSIRQRSRPTLRVVGLMVLAGVRMGREAEQWVGVRRGHDEVLKKLRALRRIRDGEGLTGESLGKRKSVR